MSKIRCFIAIDIPACQKIIDLSSQIKNSGANVKIVETKNIHITLKFLGDTEEKSIDKIEEIMKQAVKEIEPFNIKLINTGAFPNSNYIKVMWIGIIDNGELSQISNNLNEKLTNLGFKKEKRKFSPHLTIARVRSARNKEKLVELIDKYCEFEFLKIKVNSIKLKKSELTPKGPIYTTLKEVKL
jgi:2'-5' RNA ligase